MFDLRLINFSEANLAHERAQIRHIRKTDEELARLWAIEKDATVAKFVEGLAEDESDMKDFLKPKKDRLVIAIAGKTGHVDESEVGKLQGWIYVYPDEKKRIARCRKAGLVHPEKECVLEVSFAKYPGAKPGQVASALRQLLASVKRQFEKIEDVIITAYTDAANEASMRVLSASGFVNKGLIKYHAVNETEDHFFVVDWEKVS